MNNTGVNISVVKLIALCGLDVNLSNSCVVGRRSMFMFQLLNHFHQLAQWNDLCCMMCKYKVFLYAQLNLE